jgi:hypothetical protein
MHTSLLEKRFFAMTTIVLVILHRLLMLTLVPCLKLRVPADLLVSDHNTNRTDPTLGNVITIGKLQSPKVPAGNCMSPLT